MIPLLCSLAYQIQNLFDQNKLANIKQASEWLNISPSHIDHILTMLLLSPTIQTEILLGKKQIIDLIPEYKVRALASQSDWSKQSETWQNIK